MIDIDQFKIFNDANGNAAGDELLRQVATRLTDVAPGNHLVARLGGNEFAIVMEGVTNVDDGINMAERVRAALAQPFTVGGESTLITASVGVAVPQAGESPEDVIGDADTAVGIAKERGRDRVEVLTAELRNHAKRRAHVERRLRKVLDDSDAVQVHYQPIFDLASGRVVSAEALLRVHDDDGALLSPAAFLEAAESTGLIAPLGRQVILETCRQVSVWGEDGDLNTPGEVSVNLSPRQLDDPGFPDVVSEAIEEMKLPPERFSLELTESMFISQSRSIDEKIQQVRHQGVRIGLDDFGAGQSSLGYLRRFPLDFVKIDRGLVAGVGTDQEDTAIVRATVELGHNLGLLVVAVGVETQDQLDILELLGCDRAQGFFFSPAVPASQFSTTVAEKV
jgi:diguanylate cyclase (GGDEF)-like protein